jgi:curli production assembly/transport component CsgG
MIHFQTIKKALFSVLVIIIFSGCNAIMNQPMKTKAPTLGAVTNSEKRLNQLPPPKEKIMAAVYNFRDKTGQYKLTETGGSWSTAITQGATSILINALEESGWFIPIEREGLGNLLNERKIIRSSRAHYNQGSNQSQSLPPLLFAGIMLEGGIISYDHNVQTGGMGLRYFGAGASGEYRQDRVTVYLRAVSTKNGKILKNVNATKTVLSQKIDAGIFRYVKFKRLLEAETGITYNEPTEIAVKEAIEKAVESLIIEGLFDNLWDLKSPEEINSDIIQSYIQDKADNSRADVFGMTEKNRTYRFLVKAEGGINQYAGDFKGSMKQPELNLKFGYDLNGHFSSFVSLGKSYLAAKNYFHEGFNYLNLGMLYRFTPQKPYTPYLITEFGASMQSYKDFYRIKIPSEFNNRTIFPQINAGLGLEYLIGIERRLGINSSVNINYFFNDHADQVEHGYLNDYYWEGKIGLFYYF